jgi:flagellar hook-associated protein 1
MRSTFMGLETARRGLFTQQSALYTTGHNISNANTEGYSRQRVNFSQTIPYPSAGMNRPQFPGQMGTGVEAGSVQRIRDEFLDTRYRSQNNNLGYYSSQADALSRMEEVLNEPTEEGLSAALDNFWNSLQTLGTNPNESGARESVLAQANALADTFNYLSTSLDSIRADLKQNIGVSVEQINTLATQINNLNKQIGQVEPHGDLPNDLYDQRDKLVEELSKLVNIKVTKQQSGGIPSPLSEGVYKIELLDNEGGSLGTLLDKTTSDNNPNKLSFTSNNDGYIESLALGNKSDIKIENFASGSLKSDIESYGYVSSQGEQTGLYPKMIGQLDKLAFALVKEFNHIHGQGVDLRGEAGISFFQDLSDHEGAASKISVALSDPNGIAVSIANTNQGNGDNAYKLASVMRKDCSQFEAQIIDPQDPTLSINLKDYTQNTLEMSGNIKSFYGGIITSLGVQANEVNVLTKNATTLLDSVNYQRQSVSAVSLDEEMTNMIKFQQAYNASARMITVIDETIDKIINGMGTVGR